MVYEIIPSHLAVKAMRDSGYKDAAHAIAELVDNSIQAGADNVEIICADKIQNLAQRARRRIDQVAVFDNGCGMDSEQLRIALQFGNGTHLVPEEQDGIGKFGMGLPNSSISQCQKVEVWSWQKEKCLYSYLDIEEIMNGDLHEVPEPIEESIPPKWTKLIDGKIGISGTLVVWSRLDRVRWKGSKALLENSSLLIGRMYRYFLHQNKVFILLAAYSPLPEKKWERVYEEFVSPNDPLYLMNDSSCPKLPDPFEHDVMFEEYGIPDKIGVTLQDGSEHTVTVRYSIVKYPIRKKLGEIGTNPGSTPPGKHAQRNIGVSVVRAARELEINKSFVIGYDPTERWWGAEVSFSPALDEIFGVTNNKQSATAFKQMDFEADAESEGMTPKEYEDILLEENDPRVFIYRISKRIQSNLNAIRQQLKRGQKNTRKRKIENEDPAELAATKATNARKEDGYSGTSDKDEDMTPEERTEDLTRAIEELGTDPEEAKEIAVKHVTDGIKYVFQESAYDGPSFFSMTPRGGSIIVTINSNHPVSRYLYEILEVSEMESSGKALDALKLILCAWARMEDETQSEKRKQNLSDTRGDWGRMTRDFLLTAFEE